MLEEFSPVLRSAQIHDSIVLFRDMDVSCMEDDLRVIFSQWCSEMHTFVAAWGEFTLTVEDVATLFALSITSDIDFDMIGYLWRIRPWSHSLSLV